MVQSRLLHTLLMLALAAVVIIGCSTDGANPSVPLSPETNQVQPDRQLDNSETRESDTPQPLPSDKQGKPEKVDENTGTQEQNQLEISSNAEKQPKSKDKAEPELSPYNAAHPRLFGIAIGDSKESAVQRFGKPIETFLMDDPLAPIQIYKYKHFMMGFNMLDQVEFIDVTSVQIDPGLNGLHLGDTSSDAIRLLGEPDINTEYVLNYKSERAILKLDIDPNSGMINSIKLFGAD